MPPQSTTNVSNSSSLPIDTSSLNVSATSVFKFTSKAYASNPMAYDNDFPYGKQMGQTQDISLQAENSAANV